MTDVVFPDAARAWLDALGCPDQDQDAVLAEAPPFAPTTLKQVFTGVMDLGKRAGRLGETMALLGRQEAAFRHLREELGIPRAAPPEDLVPAIVLQSTPDGWIHPGRWIPDILDRAAGRDVMLRSGEPSRIAGNGPWGGSPVHVFVLGGGEVVEGSALHRVDPTDWLTPGPWLPRVIFEAASCLHGKSLSFPGV
jgi:hypothetical protein